MSNEIKIVGWVGFIDLGGNRDIFSVAEEERTVNGWGWIFEEGRITRVISDPWEVHTLLEWGVPRCDLWDDGTFCAFQENTKARAWIETYSIDKK